ncbi:MAG: dethiobiotin synthase [Psychromonas sp.]|nr:dethiobiotin synthase [Psychromonas sp.]
MSKTKKIFITGTDTDCGKTICCKALLETAAALNLSTVVYKPIAAGCFNMAGQLCNADVLILKTHCSIPLHYREINPIAFKPSIAPHIAASIEKSSIDFDVMSKGLDHLETKNADFCFIEGAGGWRLPIGDSRFLSDWVIHQDLDVILVVDMKLGCLNHAILTYQAIIQDGLNVLAWIANSSVEQMPYYQHNLSSLSKVIKSPLLAEIKHLEAPLEANLSVLVDHDIFYTLLKRGQIQP